MVCPIETINLTRHFGKNIAIEDLNIKVEAGEIFGFLGPNGAGKTTTIRLLMNFIHPTKGKIKIFDQELHWGDFSYRKEIGFLPGDLMLPLNYTGETFLRYWGALSGGKTPLRARCLQALALDNASLRRKIREYSSGMRQKLGIVSALQHHPRLLILDEPTSGLDPLVKHSFLDLLKELKEKGCTIFFSSHILSEVEQVADTTAIIRKGKLVVAGKIEQLKHTRQKRVSILFKSQTDLDKFLERYPASRKEDNLKVQFISTVEVAALLRALNGLDIADINITDPTLEDIFLQYYDDESRLNHTENPFPQSA